MIPHNRIVFTEAEKQALHDVVESGYYTQGINVSAFEARCRTYYKKQTAIAVCSGSMALRLALIACGVGENESVVVPAYCCSAIGNTVLSVGASVVACDVRIEDGNIDSNQAVILAKAHRAKVVIAVNTFGVPADIATISAAGLMVIEDCSHGFEIDDDSLPRTRGDFVIQSFYSTKLFGASELGILLFSDDVNSEYLSALREGYSEKLSAHCVNIKANEFAAVLGSRKLCQANEILTKRRMLAENYLSKPLLKAITLGVTSKRVWYRYVLSISHADRLIHNCRQHVQIVRPISPWLDNLHRYPVAAALFTRCVSLPLYPSLREKEQSTIIEKVEQFLREERTHE